MVQHDLLSLQSQAYLNKRGGKEKKKRKRRDTKKTKKKVQKERSRTSCCCFLPFCLERSILFALARERDRDFVYKHAM